jgi:hypothetical protein
MPDDFRLMPNGLRHMPNGLRHLPNGLRHMPEPCHEKKAIGKAFRLSKFPIIFLGKLFLSIPKHYP